MMTTVDEKVERLKILKECLKDQAAGVLLEPLLTTPDLERLLKVDRRTITRLVKRGELPAPLKLGGSNRWRPEDITAAIDRLGRRAGRKIEPAAGDQQENRAGCRFA
jgi:predicted DNA-binding transcriptional regulator AlpA